MQVFVDLRGPLQRYAQSRGNGLSSITLPEGSTVADLVEFLSLPGGSISIVAVNGRKADVAAVLKENDTVVIFPLLAGG